MPAPLYADFDAAKVWAKSYFPGISAGNVGCGRATTANESLIRHTALPTAANTRRWRQTPGHRLTDYSRERRSASVERAIDSIDC